MPGPTDLRIPLPWRLAFLALLAVTLLACRGTATQGPAVLRDLAYGPHEDQRLDVYLPPAPQKAPVIFMVHGGGWVSGDKADGRVVDNKASRWVPQGYIFISANNRLLPDANPLQQAEDIAAALAFAQQQAATWGGDPARFILMGHSAGAHLVALITAAPDIASAQGARPWLGTVPLDSAAYDVVSLMEESHFPVYDRAFGEDRRFWERASPRLRLQQAPVPMLLVCSTRRRHACDQARGLAERAESFGGDATVLSFALSHGEIDNDLGLPGSYTEEVETFLHRLARP